MRKERRENLLKMISGQPLNKFKGNCESRPDTAVRTVKILVPILIGTAQIIAREFIPGRYSGRVISVSIH